MKPILQSTALVISFGPFLDIADGFTEVTTLVSALDHGTTGIKLSKQGGALTIRHATVTATTYDAYGCYLVTLDPTDTNTLGRLKVVFADATVCLPVWDDFTVLPANVYNSLVLGSDLLDVNTAEIAATPSTTIADATLNRDFSAISDTNARSLLNAARYLRNKWSISGTTLTVTKENDSTAAWTATLTGTPGADPVTGSDPA